MKYTFCKICGQKEPQLVDGGFGHEFGYYHQAVTDCCGADETNISKPMNMADAMMTLEKISGIGRCDSVAEFIGNKIMPTDLAKVVKLYISGQRKEAEILMEYLVDDAFMKAQGDLENE